LDKERWVYIWADGIYSGLRAEDAMLSALVIIGVNERGDKRFLAIEDGVRESTQSWREVLLKLHECAKARYRRWCNGILGCIGKNLSRYAATALLDAQNG